MPTKVFLQGEVTRCSIDSINSCSTSVLGCRGAEHKPNSNTELFKPNVALHPDSWNTFDSLGDGYVAVGNELAIKNYKRSLELNPKNQNALEQIQKH
jgi:hypothetical protein